MAKDNLKNAEQIKEAYLGAKDYAKQLASELTKAKNVGKDTAAFAKKLSDELMGQVTAEEQINSISQLRQDYVEEMSKKGKNINITLLRTLDLELEALQIAKERDEIEEALEDKTMTAVEQAKFLKGLEEERFTIGKNLLGITDDMEKAIASGGVKALAMNTAFESVGASLEKHVDTLKDMVTQQGLSIGESLALKGSIDSASMSMTGLLFGSDALASSAEAITQKFGNVNAATSELIKGVTEVSALTGDAASATDLVLSFENAGIAADDVNEHIKDLATKNGVSAKKMLEGMTSQMHRLKGASQEQLDSILAQNAALVKQGTNIDTINDIANSVLDIESNMKASAKARVMLGRDINDNAVRAAALELQTATTEEGRAAAREKMAQAILDGVGGQEEFNNLNDKQLQSLAQAYGMTVDQLTTQMEQKRIQDELTAKYGDSADTVAALQGFFSSAAKGAAGLALEFGKVVAKSMAMNLVMNGSTGIGNLTSVFGSMTKALGLQSVATKAQTVASKAMLVVENIKNKAIQLGTAIMNSQLVTRIKDTAIKAKDLIVTKATAVAQGAMNVARGIGDTLMKSEIVRSIALTAQKVAMNVATFLGITATTGQTAANVGLATSQTTLATTGAAAGGGMAAAGAGLGAFGAAAAPAIPIILAIGAALLMASPAIYAFSFVIEALGKIIIGVLAAVPPIVTAIAEGFVTIMGAVTPENVLGLLMLGPALLSASVGMIAFSAAMAVGGIMSFFGGGIVDQIRELSEIGPGVEQAGAGLAAVAGNIAVISGAMEGLGGLVTPLYALAGGLMSISGGLAAMAFSGLMAMPIIGGLIALAAVAPALEGLASFLGGGDDDGGSGSGSDSDLLNEIKGLRSDIQAQPIMLTIDGKAVQQISRVQSRQSKNSRSFS